MRLLLLIAALLLGGCTYTRTLGDAAHRPVADDPAVVTLADGEAAPARFVHAAPDVVTWIDARGALRSAPTSDVLQIRVADRGRGAGQGALIGGLLGAVLGTGTGSLWQIGQSGLINDGSGAAAGLVVGGAVGAGLGALLGRASADTVYR